jgi:hypothetical protein
MTVAGGRAAAQLTGSFLDAGRDDEPAEAATAGFRGLTGRHPLFAPCLRAARKDRTRHEQVWHNTEDALGHDENLKGPQEKLIGQAGWWGGRRRFVHRDECARSTLQDSLQRPNFSRFFLQPPSTVRPAHTRFPICQGSGPHRTDRDRFALAPPAAARPQGRLAANIGGGPDRKKQCCEVLVE